VSHLSSLAALTYIVTRKLMRQGCVGLASEGVALVSPLVLNPIIPFPICVRVRYRTQQVIKVDFGRPSQYFTQSKSSNPNGHVHHTGPTSTFPFPKYSPLSICARRVSQSYSGFLEAAVLPVLDFIPRSRGVSTNRISPIPS
jgi:hypothetical protein